MYIERVPNRNSPPAVLLRESYREGSKVRKRTLANLSSLPDEAVDGLRILLKGGTAIENLPEAFEITRSRPHGHVAAVLGTLKNIGLHNTIAPESSRNHNLVVAMIVARIVDPVSKLATARGLDPATCSSTLGELLGVSLADEDQLYEAMDWLLSQQAEIEQRLAQKHLCENTLVLYDVSSTYFEGSSCPLAQFGYSRDKKKGKLQITFGLICNGAGCPVAVEVFDGNTGDPTTFTPQIEKVRSRFGIKHVIWVGDRGMITQARIKQDLQPVEGLHWITSLRCEQIRALVEQEAIQLSLFDQQDLAEISCADYPNERLIACRNPLLAEQRKTKREELLTATERELDKIVAATQRQKRRLVGAAQIGLRVGAALNQFKVKKHFQIEITDENFSYQRNPDSIATEAALDGLYVIRTDVSADTLDADSTVRAYKSLSSVEQAFRSYKTVDLKVRPIYHHLADRVKAHVFLCMLAYYLEWHMRKRLAPILFDDDSKVLPESTCVVAPAVRSDAAIAKAQTKRTLDGFPVHSFQSLLTDLGTITNNRIQSTLSSTRMTFDKITTPTPLQQKAFDLLGVSVFCTQ